MQEGRNVQLLPPKSRRLLHPFVIVSASKEGRGENFF